MKTWHYSKNFGMHFDLHATDLDTELGKSITHETLKRTLEIMKPEWIQCDCKGHMGLTAWPTEVATMAEGTVKDALRIHSDVCKELGIPLGVHFTGLWDRKALIDHPEWVAVGPNGEPYSDQGYYWMPYPACPNSAFWDEMMIPNMLEVIEKYDVDGFWIDGDTWANKLCYCDKCKAEFKAKYGFDAPVYKETKTEFVGFVKKEDYSKNYDCSFEDWMKWINFHRDKYLANVNKYVDAVHNKKPECLVVVNWLGCFGLTLEDKGVGDYFSGDEPLCTQNAMINGHYFTQKSDDWEIMSWSMQNDGTYQNWDLKSKTQLKQDYAYIMACGGACLCCHQPTRSGLIADQVSDLIADAGEFVKARAPYVRHNKSIKEIAVIASPEDINEKNGEMLIGPNTTQPQMNKFYGLVNILNGTHYQYDVYYPEMIENLSDFQLVILTDQSRWSEDFLVKLEEYVKNGGNVLIEGVNSVDTFKNLLGVEPIEIESFDEFTSPVWQRTIYVPINNEVATFQGDFYKVKCKEAKAIKYYMKGLVHGECETDYPAMTVNEYGKGKVVGIYNNMYEEYKTSFFKRYRDIFDFAIKQFDTDFIIQDVKAPYYANLVLREKDGLVISCMNVGSIVQNNMKQVFSEELPEIPEISFKVKIDEPKEVKLVPDNSRLSYFYKDGFLNVTIRDLDILDILVIK